MESMVNVYIDADACPVKDEVFKVAMRYDVEVYLVSNQWLRLVVGPRVHKVVVSDGFDAADDWIAERADAHDVVVTADIPLASRCLEKGAGVLGHNGKPFSNDNIGMAMSMRTLNQDLRDMGTVKGYNKPFDKKDRSRFLSTLDEMVKTALREAGQQ